MGATGYHYDPIVLAQRQVRQKADVSNAMGNSVLSEVNADYEVVIADIAKVNASVLAISRDERAMNAGHLNLSYDNFVE